MAVFIDADNLNDATALDHVLTDLRHRAERVLYKRAYGRVDSLRGIESVLWRHGVRPVSNMIVNKVTTDSALVIDAVEAVCTQDIDTVAICSGDADFVPLATWVRERGCHVLCFSLSHKIFANPESFYDEVVLLEVVEKPQSPAASTIAEPELPQAIDSEPSSRDVEEALGSEIRPAGGFAAGPKPLAPQPSTKELVEQVLRALPSLRNGQSQHLSQVVSTLRQRGVLGKTTKTSVWFAQLGGCFQLQPSQKPNQIAYISDAQAKKLAKATRDAASASSAMPPPEMVQRVLTVLPDLRRGPQMLSQVVPLLRQKMILGKTTKSTTFFGQFPSHFKLAPQGQPTQVTYVEPSAPNVATNIPLRRDSANGTG
ncbi:NYN domain-containing protein [Acidovorax sp. 69]|uniref:NYN domain-containing protein n=1 Tax=Acidovorax sp. 69 TaxID=2035202 RepID=UPI001E5A6660|nr:NYN domain-containing protein [Acidovorax sp. 69]